MNQYMCMKKILSILGILVLLLIIFWLFPKPATNTVENNNISGWDRVLFRGVYETENWNQFQEIDDNISSFSIETPASWEQSSSVFMEGESKVAEVTPGLVRLKSGQECFVPEDNTGVTVLSRDRFEYDGLDIKLKTIVVDIDQSVGGSQYVYRYCLSNGEYAAVLNFYADEFDNDRAGFFEDVVLSTMFNINRKEI